MCQSENVGTMYSACICQLPDFFLFVDGSSNQQLPPTIVDVQEDSRASFPLGLCHATHYVKERAALIG